MPTTTGDIKAPFIIADIGSNFFVGQSYLEMAKRHIFDAARAGCDAVKFQFFTDQELYGIQGPNRWALPCGFIPELSDFAQSNSIEFMCTAFSVPGYEFVDNFVNIHKVASCEMKHLKILDFLRGTGKPVLISTGAAHHDEIGLVRNYMNGTDFGFMECVASYPARAEDYDLNTLRNPDYIGLSDHTLSDVVALTSIGFGASVFEKHFCSFDDGKSNTPDAPVSIGPKAMADYCNRIREAHASIGDGYKLPRASERDITMRARRRLKVTKPVKAGERLEFDKNYGIYRSLVEDVSAGPPEAWQIFNGGTAKRDLIPGDPVWISTVELKIESTPTS